MGHWTQDTIPWDRFDPSQVDPDLLKVVKAAAMVERNAADYTAYLLNIFQEDERFCAYAGEWQAEEEQHGDVLGRWAELADPTFSYAEAFQRFREAYRIDVNATQSVRGSRTGEMVARCIVETGTSSFYSALRDATTEPVLKEICHRIAGDEFRHYKVFYTTMKTWQAREGVSALKRFLVAVGRIRESEDDELATAYHVANNDPATPYNHRIANLNYSARAYSVYRPVHVERATNMVLKASGMNPQTALGRLFGRIMWRYVAGKAKRLDQALKQAA